MGKDVTVSANGLSVAHAKSKGKITSTIPDICSIPGPNGKIPLPLMSEGKLEDLSAGTMTVKIQNASVAVLGSYLSKCKGDKAGILGGIISGETEGKCFFFSFSPDVMMEMRPVVRKSDRAFMNMFNTVCMGGVDLANVEEPKKSDARLRQINFKIVDSETKSPLRGISMMVTPPEGPVEAYESSRRGVIAVMLNLEKEGSWSIEIDGTKHPNLTITDGCQKDGLDTGGDYIIKVDTFVAKIKFADDNRIITPLKIPDYEEITTGTTLNQDKLKFELEIQTNKIDSAKLEFKAGPNTVYSEDLPAGSCEIGKHEITWDGFSKGDILDTKVLKNPDLEMKVIGELDGVKKETIFKLNPEYAEQEWVDVKIDRGSLTIDVELRIELDDGGETGVGELPPDGYSGGPHVRIHDFSALKQLAVDGIRGHWSRNISSPDGYYDVTVNPVVTEEKSMDDLDIKYNTNNRYIASSNPGSVTGIISLGANVVPEEIVYNVGYLNYNELWEFGTDWGILTKVQADAEFKYCAAHEIGHEILKAYGGQIYSYQHKGSSSLFQGGGDPAPGRVTKADLMKYYNVGRGTSLHPYRNITAHENDVKSLIWLSRLEFNEKSKKERADDRRNDD